MVLFFNTVDIFTAEYCGMLLGLCENSPLLVVLLLLQLLLLLLLLLLLFFNSFVRQ